MTPAIIRHELKKLHIRGIAAYAEQIGYSDHSVYGCINGNRFNSRVARIIAETLDRPQEEVWGDIYPDRFTVAA